MDEMDIKTEPGKGTKITIIKWLNRKPYAYVIQEEAQDILCRRQVECSA